MKALAGTALPAHVDQTAGVVLPMPMQANAASDRDLKAVGKLVDATHSAAAADFKIQLMRSAQPELNMSLGLVWTNCSKASTCEK